MIVKADAKVLSTLKNLLQTCRDREQGYRTAQGGTPDSELKKLFEMYADQSARFAQELEDLVHTYGGEAKAKGTLAGAAFRGWMNIKAVVTGGDEAALLSECEQGEDVAVRNYRKATDNPRLPTDLGALIARQFSQIEDAHRQLRMLRDAVRHA